ncbi:MAG TPA: polysaccharide biosynthesis protein, partial [Syntrophomonas wolfei]|nr:polysaccharide biosynthesis protein [Syntrophomonas wolfei]
MTYWLRLILMLLFDSCLINLSIGFSLWLRFEGEGGIPANYLTAFFSLIPWYTFITLGALYAMRLYHRMWKYASIGELYGIVKAVTTSTAIVIILIYTIPLSYLPRSVYIMSWVFMIIFIGGSRLSWRLL